MSYTITQNGSTVMLPLAPKRTRFNAGANIKESTYPTARNLVISYGRKADKLTWEGVIAEYGKGAGKLDKNYLSRLTNMVYKEVVISAPGERYDGSWIMNSFQYSERGGYTVSFEYTLEFIKGTRSGTRGPGIVIT